MIYKTKIGKYDFMLGTENKEANVSGLEISLMKNENDNLKGVSMALSNSSKKARGVQFGMENVVGIGDYLFQLGITNVAKQISGAQVSLGYNLADKVKGWQFAPFNKSKEVYGSQTGIYNSTKLLDGFQFGAYSETENLLGMQSGGINYAKKGKGFQLGSINYTDNYKGVQTGFANVAKKNVGVQSGALNFSNESQGAQVGVLNNTKDIEGLQTGIFNVAKKMKGIQFGLFNVCGEDSGGIQIGLLNYRPGNGQWYTRFTPFIAFRGRR
ncbi:hypothetical protein J4474_04345 [Candidatus Pacearchaeota archaeon]|nr:hypothetical protein [Candidatus Pacearchaeota archaeon]